MTNALAKGAKKSYSSQTLFFNFLFRTLKFRVPSAFFSSYFWLSRNVSLSNIPILNPNNKITLATIRRHSPSFPNLRQTGTNTHSHADNDKRFRYVPISVPGFPLFPNKVHLQSNNNNIFRLVPFRSMSIVVVVVVAGFAYSIELDLFGAQLHRTTTSGATRSGPSRSTRRTSGRPPSLKFALPLLFLLFALPPGLVQLGVSCFGRMIVGHWQGF